MGNNFGLYQKGGRGNWYLPIYLDDKKITKSTQTSDLREAIRRAPEIIAKARSAGGHWDTPEVLGPTISEAFDKVIALKGATGTTKGTIKNYEKTKTAFVTTIGQLRIKALTRVDIVKFINKRMNEQKNKLSTIRAHLLSLSAVLTEMRQEHNDIPTNKAIFPSQYMSSSVCKAKTRFLLPEEISKLVQAANPRHRDYILAYVYTGCRKTELFDIRKADIDFERNIILVRGRKTEGSFASIPLATALRPVLERRCAGLLSQGFVFPPIASLTPSLRRACKRAGIEKATTHDLRRTTGSLLASAGVDIRQVASLLRHENIQTTVKTYGHLTPRARQQAVDTLPTITLPEPQEPRIRRLGS